MYVSGSSETDITPRAGTITDPHRSLTGAMASISTEYTVIKLLDSYHYLTNFDQSAFPLASSNSDPKNPFKYLTVSVNAKVIIKPEFCSNSPNTV